MKIYSHFIFGQVSHLIVWIGSERVRDGSGLGWSTAALSKLGLGVSHGGRAAFRRLTEVRTS